MAALLATTAFGVLLRLRLNVTMPCTLTAPFPLYTTAKYHLVLRRWSNSCEKGGVSTSPQRISQDSGKLAVPAHTKRSKQRGDSSSFRSGKTERLEGATKEP